MAIRSFTDSAGTTWQVWDIVPVLSERRSANRRARTDVEVPVQRAAERRSDDRRITQSRRAVLRGSYASGWIVFESDRERRRLAPIPSDWRTCSERLLETYVRHAELVVHGRSATGAPFDHGLGRTG